MTDITAVEEAKPQPLITASAVQQILRRYEAGEQFREICKDHGVSHVTLYKYVIHHAEQQWKDLQVARALARKESAEEQLDDAKDQLSVNQARERLKAAQWDLERVCRRIYVQDAPPVQISINLNESVQRIKDLERELGLPHTIEGTGVGSGSGA